MEKSRDFNRFLNYNLDFFEETLTQFSKNSTALNISIIGTNGKGSTTEILANLILKNNISKKIGVYTSPHLISKFERIKINDSSISENYFEDFLNSKTEEEISILKKLSFFEFFTLVAKNYFSDSKTEINLFEAGLGGRLDATKLMNSEIIILTKIGLDHKEILGDTKEKILIEKLGIISKSTKKIFHFEKDESLKKIIRENVNEFNLEEYFFFSHENLDYLNFNFNFSKFILEKLFFKKINLEKVSISGRIEVLKNSPLRVFDISHNPDGVKEFLKSSFILFPNLNSIEIILACLSDKDLLTIFQILADDFRIKKIHRLIGENWNNEKLFHPKLNLISESDLELVLKLDFPIFILGSFRIYEKVKKIV